MEKATRDTIAEQAHPNTGPGDEMGGAPYPSDMTMPDPRRGDRGGDFEGETDPRVRGGAADSDAPERREDA